MRPSHVYSQWLSVATLALSASSAACSATDEARSLAQASAAPWSVILLCVTIVSFLAARFSRQKAAFSFGQISILFPLLDMCQSTIFMGFTTCVGAYWSMFSKHGQWAVLSGTYSMSQDAILCGAKQHSWSGAAVRSVFVHGTAATISIVSAATAVILTVMKLILKVKGSPKSHEGSTLLAPILTQALLAPLCAITVAAFSLECTAASAYATVATFAGPILIPLIAALALNPSSKLQWTVSPTKPVHLMQPSGFWSGSCELVHLFRGPTSAVWLYQLWSLVKRIAVGLVAGASIGVSGQPLAAVTISCAVLDSIVLFLKRPWVIVAWNWWGVFCNILQIVIAGILLGGCGNSSSSSVQSAEQAAAAVFFTAVVLGALLAVWATWNVVNGRQSEDGNDGNAQESSLEEKYTSSAQAGKRFDGVDTNAIELAVAQSTGPSLRTDNQEQVKEYKRLRGESLGTALYKWHEMGLQTRGESVSNVRTLLKSDDVARVLEQCCAKEMKQAVCAVLSQQSTNQGNSLARNPSVDAGLGVDSVVMEAVMVSWCAMLGHAVDQALGQLLPEALQVISASPAALAPGSVVSLLDLQQYARQNSQHQLQQVQPVLAPKVAESSHASAQIGVLPSIPTVAQPPVSYPIYSNVNVQRQTAAAHHDPHSTTDGKGVHNAGIPLQRTQQVDRDSTETPSGPAVMNSALQTALVQGTPITPAARRDNDRTLQTFGTSAPLVYAAAQGTPSQFSTPSKQGSHSLVEGAQQQPAVHKASNVQKSASQSAAGSMQMSGPMSLNDARALLARLYPDNTAAPSRVSPSPTASIRPPQAAATFQRHATPSRTPARTPSKTTLASLASSATYTPQHSAPQLPPRPGSAVRQPALSSLAASTPQPMGDSRPVKDNARHAMTPSREELIMMDDDDIPLTIPSQDTREEGERPPTVPPLPVHLSPLKPPSSQQPKGHSSSNASAVPKLPLNKIQLSNSGA